MASDRKIVKDGLAPGIIGGLIGTLCCWPVFVLLLLGLSGVAVGLSFLVEYAWYLRALGALFIAGALYYKIKHKHGVCNLHTIEQNKLIIVTAVVIYIVLIVVVSLIRSIL